MHGVTASRTITYGLGAAIAAGAILLADIYADFGAALIVGIGVGVILGQCIHCRRIARIIHETHGPSRVMFQRGKDLGYQEGWRDCARRFVGPVVVPMMKAHERSEEFSEVRAPFFSR